MSLMNIKPNKMPNLLKTSSNKIKVYAFYGIKLIILKACAMKGTDRSGQADEPFF